MKQALTNVTVKRDEKTWEVEVRAEIPAEVLQHYRALALKEATKTAKVDGFRPGHAPEDAVLRIYGEAAIMRRATEDAIQNELPEILAKENQLIIEAPRVTTDPPEAGKSVVFTARAALAPEVKLADYKTIAKKHTNDKKAAEVTDEEHYAAMTHLRRERARIDKIESGVEPQQAAEEIKALEEKDLPLLDDEFVEALGYANAETFSDALRSNILNEKELRAAEARRAAILEELAKGSSAKYPQALLEYELDDMESRLTGDLSRTNLTMEAYLTDIKKTREELRESWKDAADKRATIRLILAEIARTERIEADEARVKQEIDHAVKLYPKADVEALRAHIVHALRNEAVLKWLEELA